MDERTEISTTMKVAFAFLAGVLVTGGLALVLLRHREVPPKPDVPQQSAVAGPSAAATTSPVPPASASAAPPVVHKSARPKLRPSAFSKESSRPETSRAVAEAPLPQSADIASSADSAANATPDNQASGNPGPGNTTAAAPVASAQNLPDVGNEPSPQQAAQNAPGQQAIAVTPQPVPVPPRPAATAKHPGTSTTAHGDDRRRDESGGSFGRAALVKPQYSR